jgi:ribosomal protein S12 methylthiotransferase accessory factor YcaO
LVLLQSVIASTPQPVRRVDLLTLPWSLRQMVSVVKDESDAVALQLWDITSDTGVATLLFGLTIETPTGRYRYFGSGASLSPAYAAERAMLEALQGFHIHQRLGDFEQPPLPEGGTEAMSLYRRCEMDAGLFECRGGEEVVDFASVPATETLEISAQIAFLVDRLCAIDCSPYRRTIHASAAVSIVQVLVPQFERFYLVERGIAVAPSWRGRRLLTSTA